MSNQALSLQTNVGSLNAQRAIAKTEKSLGTSMSRLASGMRIISGADDAAGLAISEKMKAQIRGMAQAQRNANDGVSLLQTAEGALNEVSDMLTRMRELAIESANGTLGNNERISIDDEYTQLVNEINRIAGATEFNGLKLLNGNLSTGVTFQVGTQNNATNDRITVSLANTTAASVGLTGGITLSTVTGAQNSLALIDSAIQSVSSRRGTVGAMQNRLNVTINNLAAMHENLSAANSRIRDADVASEAANFTRTQILMQSGISVLSQANQLPQLALSLL